MPFREVLRDQTFLLPARVDDWIAADHPARFVWAFVQELGLSGLGICAAPEVLGAPAYPPQVLLACWLYGFMDGKRSSRALERACREALPYVWLAGLLHPDHVTLWRFYNSNRAAMGKLLRETVRVAVKVGLVDFALQCVDGTKMEIASNDQLRRKGALEKLLARVEEEIAALEQREGQDEPPAQRAQCHKARAKKADLRERVRRAMQGIESESGKHKRGKEPVAQVSDPEARLVKTRHGWKVGYNAQVMVDSKSEIIVAAEVAQQMCDVEQLIPLLEQEEQECGRCGDVTVGDNGYFSASNVEAAAAHTDFYTPDKAYEKQVQQPSPYHASQFEYRPSEDLYICPQNKVLPFARPTNRGKGGTRGWQYQCHDCVDCPVRAQCTRSRHGRSVKRMADALVLQAHRRKMASDTARAYLKRRASLVEAVFGIIKQCQGGQRFLMRGLQKVTQEWRLLCAALNLRKLWRNWAVQARMAAAA